MRVYKKKEIINLLQVIKKLQKSLGVIQGMKVQEKQYYLSEMQRAAMTIGTEIEKTEKNKEHIIKILEDYCEDIYRFNIEKSIENGKKLIVKMCEQISLVEQIIVNEIANDKLEVLFLPYKAEMWTSFESIWKEAKQDEDTHTLVMPIPYYDIGNANNIKMKYEAERFPQYVDIINYKEYSLEKEHPDIVLIHNPYDGYNTLTRIPECYYSSNIKKVCGILVYSPYFTVGAYKQNRYELMFTTPGVKNADYIIAQSNYVKEIFQKYGCSCERVLDFGSPKVDAVIESEHHKDEIPMEWRKKIKDKKVFLLNTHLTYFPSAFVRTNSLDNYAVKFHKEILETFIDREDCALIWRPHPLLRNMLEDKFPMCIPFVDYFEKTIKHSSNGIIDEKSSYLSSFSCSNALISTWSSLINEYMVTGKPVMIFQKKMDEITEKESPLNRNLNYFRMGKDGMSFSQFRDYVISGVDPLYNDRKKAVKAAFPNLEGDAGKKIYAYLKETYKGGC